MTHRLATNYAKNYCNRTPIVKVIVENVVTCFFWDTVYKIMRFRMTPRSMILDDLELLKNEFSRNFVGFHRLNLGAIRRLNE